MIRQVETVCKNELHRITSFPFWLEVHRTTPSENHTAHCAARTNAICCVAIICTHYRRSTIQAPSSNKRIRQFRYTRHLLQLVLSFPYGEGGELRNANAFLGGTLHLPVGRVG